jgi:hypothetical protein
MTFMINQILLTKERKFVFIWGVRFSKSKLLWIIFITKIDEEPVYSVTDGPMTSVLDRKFRLLKIKDDFNKESLAIEVDTSLPALRVIRVLNRLI